MPAVLSYMKIYHVTGEVSEIFSQNIGHRMTCKRGVTLEIAWSDDYLCFLTCLLHASRVRFNFRCGTVAGHIVLIPESTLITAPVTARENSEAR